MGYKYNPFTSNFDRVEAGSVAPDIETITGDSGGAVGPDGAFNINLLGNPEIDVVGTPGTNTLQLTDLTKWTPFVVDITPGKAPYSVIQDALDAASVLYLSSGIPQVVLVRMGNYTENLTLYDGVDLYGAHGQVDTEFLVINGVHALPTTGDCGVYGIWFKGVTACFTASSGDCKVNMFNVITEISGTGYTFDIDGFGGELNIFDYLQFDGGVNGFVYNPTGGCEVNIIFAGVGLSQNLSATAQISGNSFFQGMLVSINMNFVGNSSTQLNMGCELQGTISTQDSASVDIANTYCFVGTAKAINHLSSGTVTLTNVGINSSNVTPVDGTGTLNLANVSFVNQDTLAGTLTLNGGTIASGLGSFNNLTFDRGATTLSANGQLWIGAAGLNPAPATLTPGNGITITNAAHFIRIDTTTSVATSYATDSGSAIPSAHILNVLGGTGCATTGSGNTVTVNLDATVPLSFPTDSGTATPAANALTIAGGTNINTSGSGATVTVNLDTNISVGTIDCTQVTVDPGASGDSFVQFDINSTGEFRIGVDDDAADAFKISQGSALGTNDTQVITADGEVTFPLTPAFLATHTADQTNITGNSTLATINFTTEVFDQNADYDGTNTFTAPVSGRYLFNCSVFTQGYIAATSYEMRFNTSNRAYRSNFIAPLTVATTAGLLVLNHSVFADMDALDTCSVQIRVIGESSDIIDSLGEATIGYFGGSLQC